MIQAFFLILLAGILNGSFALPTKHIKAWQFENIWLTCGFWSYLILPWLIALMSLPQIFQVYARAQTSLCWAMILGGLGFGVGQVCFVNALKIIGFSLSFVINLGIGIGLGFSLPLIILHPEDIFSLFGLITLVGALLAITGLLLSSYAGRLYEHEKDAHLSNQKNHTMGCVLAAIAGLFSAGQNFTFSLTTPMQDIARELGATPLTAAISVWPGFLFFTFVPFAFYMLYRHQQQNSWKHLAAGHVKHYHLFAFIMGCFWYASVVLYSKAAQNLGAMGPVVAWPVFMVLIILTSNFWGWRYHEWKGSSTRVCSILLAGIGTLVLAIAVLALGSAYR